MKPIVVLILLLCSSNTSFGQDLDPIAVNITEELEIREIAEGVYIHTTYRDIAGVVRFPSNGLLIASGNEAFLVDTAWGVEETEALLNWASTQLQVSITGAVFTHADEDRMIGVDVLREAGARSYAIDKTFQEARRKGINLPDSMIVHNQSLYVGTRKIETGVPGPGHSRDNIVVYLPDSGILFGGSMVRPLNTISLGNVDDADIEEWARSLANVHHRFRETEVVIPSHGKEGDMELLYHTVQLVKEYRHEGLKNAMKEH